MAASGFHPRDATSPRAGPVYRFSVLRGMPVRSRDSGETTGKCRDLVVSLSGDDLVVRLLAVRGIREEATWLLPWENVAHIDAKSIYIESARHAKASSDRAELPLRVGRDLVRRKIIDRVGERAGTVRDLLFVMDREQLVLLDLDLSFIASIARRVGLQLRKRHLVPWHEVEPQSVGSRPQPLRLR
jgi:uncharacterized protein YrrD